MLKPQGQAFWHVKKNVQQQLSLEVSCMPEGEVNASACYRIRLYCQIHNDDYNHQAMDVAPFHVFVPGLSAGSRNGSFFLFCEMK